MRPSPLVTPRPFESGLPIIVPRRRYRRQVADPCAVPIYPGLTWLRPRAPVDDAMAKRARMLALITALQARHRSDHRFLAEASALIWGCDTVALSGIVHLNYMHKHQQGAHPMVRRHSRRIPEREHADVDGFPVTTLARTVVDCARTLPERSGIVIADSALRRGLDASELEEAVASAGRSRGIRAARSLLPLADGAAESPGESILRLIILRSGLPRPIAQVPIDTHLGRKYGDLGWPEYKVVIEFDGLMKYPESEAGLRRFLLDEKRRQDAIEEAGWRVLRVLWEDLYGDPTRLITRIRTVLHIP